MSAHTSVEFLIWLLVAASVIAVIAKRIGIPYTVALVIGGLLLSAAPIGFLAPLQMGQRPEWLTPDVILTLFLPALLFEGSLKINVRHLVADLAPLLLLANAGVLIATLVIGFALSRFAGMPVIVALLFGAMVDRKSTRLNSSHPSISYAVFCLKKKKIPVLHPKVVDASDLTASHNPISARVQIDLLTHHRYRSRVLDLFVGNHLTHV